MQYLKRFLMVGLFLLSAFRVCGQEAGALLWSNILGVVYYSSPAIASDGTIYVTSSSGHLDALNAWGQRKWSFATDSDIKSSPAIGDDGTIYFGSRDRKFYAVTSQGKLKWSFTTGAWIDASPAIAADGTVYFGSWDEKFYAVDAVGNKKWEFATSGPVDSSAAIARDGTIYFGSHDKKFYALNPNGSVKWSFATGGPIISSPAIAADDTIYFTSTDGKLYALTPEGKQKWLIFTGGVRESSPVIDQNGFICVGVNKVFTAYRPDGSVKKVWDMGIDNIDSSGAVTADGRVIFTSQYGALFNFTTNGVIQWGVDLGEVRSASPNVAPDGTIYLGTCSTKFFAIKGTAGLASGPWPVFRGNIRQTGRAPENR